MAASVAKIVELSAESTESFDHALETGVQRASKTIKGIKGVWIKDQEALIDGGKITKYRVHLKVTFELND